MPKKSDTCPRCQAKYALGYTHHQNFGSCMMQAERSGRAARNSEVEAYRKENADAWSKFHAEEEARRKDVAELKKRVVEKQANERPMSDAELVAMSNMAQMEKMRCGPFGVPSHLLGEASIYAKVMAELKRRGLI